MRELIRVGAFQRSVLIVVTPTGTGWVDPASVSSVEYLHRGNIATVAVQYSYLPSYLALLTQQLGADFFQATEAAPPGFGHAYAPADYIDAWRALTEPTGWSDDDLRRLRLLFAGYQR